MVPPTTLDGLLKIKSRAELGNIELAQKHPDLIEKLSMKEPRSEKLFWLGKYFDQPLALAERLPCMLALNSWRLCVPEDS